MSAPPRQASPDVEPQVGADVQIWPAYDEYAAKTDRQIPVVVLDRG